MAGKTATIMKKTLLITGGAGFLGQHIVRAATTWQTHATYYQSQPSLYPHVTYHHCDLRDRTRVGTLLASVRPDVMIHTACSNHSAQEVNSIVPAARVLAEASQGASCRFLHMSTDLVFDGEEAPYDEESLPKPISTYGQAKADAEQLISDCYPQAVIIRSSLMYGVDPVDHQTRWLLDGLVRHKPVRLFTDEFRSPIWVKTLAASLLELAETDFVGILHIAGPESFSRWEFGLAMLDLLNRTRTENILPSTRAEAGAEPSSRLDLEH